MIKVLMVVILASAAMAAIYYVLNEMRVAKACSEQLLRIYKALELYELDRGALPTLAYFPDDAFEDPDSLMVALTPFGIDHATAICPSSPGILEDIGLTYIWNVRLNGQKLSQTGEPQWMLVEMSALSADVPAPHMGRYNVLYTDGTIRQLRDPLQELRGL